MLVQAFASRSNPDTHEAVLSPMNHPQIPFSSHLHRLSCHRILHIFFFSSEVYASVRTKTSQKRRPINFVAQKCRLRARNILARSTSLSCLFTCTRFFSVHIGVQQSLYNSVILKKHRWMVGCAEEKLLSLSATKRFFRLWLHARPIIQMMRTYLKLSGKKFYLTCYARAII